LIFRRSRTSRRHPQAEQLFGYATDVTPGGTRWSPRIGFNYSPRGNATEQIRGGIGAFSGRTPYVWLSNQFGNTGIEITRIGAGNAGANRIPFVADAANQPKVVTGAAAGSFTNEIDLIDPDYKYPTLMRGNLAYDRELPWGLVSSAEVLFTKNLQGHQVPEPEPRALRPVPVGMPRGRRYDACPGRPADSQPAEQQLLGRDLPDELGRRLLVEHDVRVAPPVQERLVRAGLIPLRRVEVDHGRHVEPGGL
jgi:hypothetical protein